VLNTFEFSVYYLVASIDLKLYHRNRFYVTVIDTCLKDT